jgi:peptidoglycan hydrolase CwlO-like protein
MEVINILTAIGGIMLGIISWFLKATMAELKEVKDLSYSTKNQLDILKNDHINKYANMSDKMDELKSAVYDLTKEIATLNRSINKRDN